MRSSLASTTRNVHALVRASNLATSGHFNKTLGSRNATHYGFAAATTEAKGLTRDAVVRAYSVDPSVGASISRQMKDAEKAIEDAYFRAEDIEALKRLTRIARKHVGGEEAAELEQLRKIVGTKVNEDILKKLVKWKHHE